MTVNEVDADMAALIEELAAVEHERWSHWQRYIHGKASRKADGSLVLPADQVARWERQMETPFEDLSREEKDSDREQVRRYVPILQRWLARIP